MDQSVTQAPARNGAAISCAHERVCFAEELAAQVVRGETNKMRAAAEMIDACCDETEAFRLLTAALIRATPRVGWHAYFGACEALEQVPA